MNYYSQLRAMNNAQAAYDGQEAPEYYEDDEFPSWADGKRLIAEFNAGQTKEQV